MIDQISDQLITIIDLGGPVVVLLIFLSVVSLAVALYKAVQFLLVGVGSHKKAYEAIDDWIQGNEVKALASLRDSKSLLGKMAVYAMDRRRASRFKQTDSGQLESNLLTEAESELGALERGFRILDSIAQIAPLLGLFGTVLGMIDAFQKLQSAGNSVDPSILAGGIWVALLTTAVGLAVAMPTSLFLTFFESRVARERLAMEVAIARILSSGADKEAAHTRIDYSRTASPMPNMA